MTMLIPWKRGRSVPSRGVRPFSWNLDEFDRLFDEMWGGLAEGPARVGFSPRVDIHEDEAEYRITAELPGLEEKDFDVHLEGGVLTLKGEKRDERSEERKSYRHVESVAGSFERRFQLPAEVDPDSVAASYRNGVLTVTLPKAAGARPRTIPVTAS
jgi:HSP20 family protein